MATNKTKAVQIKEGQKFYAYADCEIDGKPLLAGAEFVPPFGWERNLAQEQLLLSAKQKNGSRVGMVFSYQGEIINPHEKNIEQRERRTHNIILPIEVR